MKKTVSLFLSIVMILGLVTIPVTAAGTDGVVMLDMDFESANPANLLTTMKDSTAKAKYLFDTDINNVKVSWTSSDTTKAPQTLNEAKDRGYIGVVNATTEGINDSTHSGNVFKYYHVKGEEDAGAGFLMTKFSPTSDDTSISDHTLVVEYDVYINKLVQQTGLLNVMNDAADYRSSYLGQRTNLYTTKDKGNIRYDGTSTHTGFNVADLHGSWHTVKIVADLTSKTSGEKDTFRLYIDGALQKTVFKDTAIDVYDLLGRTDSNFPDIFYGLEMGGKTGANNLALYYDNVKVTKYAGKFQMTEETIPETIEFDTNYTVTFNRAVDEGSAAKVYVADELGNKIDGAVTASSADSVLTVKFNDGFLAAKTNYNLVFPVTYTDEFGQGLVTYYSSTTTPNKIISFKTPAELERPVKIYEETFENWFNGNLLTKAVAGNTNYYTANASKDSAQPITVGVYDGTGATTLDTTGNNIYLGAVDAATEGVDANGTHTGNVLKYTNNVHNKYFMVNLLGNSDNIKGKITVVESEVYIPDNAKIMEAQLPTVTNNGTDYSTYLSANAGLTLQRNGVIVAQSGKYDADTDRSGNETYIHKIGKVTDTNGSWHKLKVVYTDKGNDTAGGNPDTWRVYVDDVLVESTFVDKSGGTELSANAYDYEHRNYNYTSSSGFANYNIGNYFYGILLGGKGRNSSETETNGNLYFDNITVKTINSSFAVTAATRDAAKFNTATDVVTLTFTQPIDTNTVKNIQIVDANDTIIANAIKSVAYSDLNTVMNITLDSDKLARNKEYKVILPATLTDIYGQGLVTYYNPYRSGEAAKTDTNWYNTSVPKSADKLAITVKTIKSGEIFIDDVLDGYDSTTGTFTKTLTVNSIATEPLPVWIAAAAYDERSCMIGFAEAGDVFTLGAGEKTTKDISLTVETGKTAKYIRIFVWNGDDTMKPYQAFEEIIVQ